MPFPVIIIGGIYGGIFSPSEAASVSVLSALLLELVIFRSLKLADIPQIALSTGLITAVLFILVAAGAAFSWTISFAQIPQAILGAIGSATPPFGCDIFTAIAIFKRPYFEVIRGTPPFFAMLLVTSVLLILFPQIALFLRDLAFR